MSTQPTQPTQTGLTFPSALNRRLNPVSAFRYSRLRGRLAIASLGVLGVVGLAQGLASQDQQPDPNPSGNSMFDGRSHQAWAVNTGRSHDDSLPDEEWGRYMNSFEYGGDAPFSVDMYEYALRFSSSDANFLNEDLRAALGKRFDENVVLTGSLAQTWIGMSHGPQEQLGMLQQTTTTDKGAMTARFENGMIVQAEGQEPVICFKPVETREVANLGELTTIEDQQYVCPAPIQGF